MVTVQHRSRGNRHKNDPSPRESNEEARDVRAPPLPPPRIPHIHPLNPAAPSTVIGPLTDCQVDPLQKMVLGTSGVTSQFRRRLEASVRPITKVATVHTDISTKNSHRRIEGLQAKGQVWKSSKRVKLLGEEIPKSATDWTP